MTPSTAPLDVAAVRGDFRSWSAGSTATALVYLDSAATSQKPRQVLEAMDDYYRRHNANVHQGVHTLAEEATHLFEEARGKVARFVGASERATVFTKNVSEAINLVAYAWGCATSARATRSWSPRWSTTPTWCPGSWWPP